MATRRELEAKLKSVRGLRDIVHSMRSLAAVNIRRAEEGLATIREYAELVADLFRLTAPLLPGGHRWREQEGAAAIIVFASDQGLCGQFNERIIEFVLEEAGALGAEARLVVIGERGAALLAERGIEPALRQSSPRSLAGVEEAMRRLAARLLEIYSAAGFGSLHLAYNRYESAGIYSPVREQILPPPLHRLLGGPVPSQPPLLYSSPEEVAAQLIEEYLFIELYRALGESLASENGARLRAMDEAIHNIDKTIDVLTLQYRITRQEEITAEILDVVSGVEALRRPRRR
jgi:F-type H+-transporting ATPase subunit gamma